MQRDCAKQPREYQNETPRLRFIVCLDLSCRVESAGFCSNSGGPTESGYRRYRMDADLLSPGPLHDDPGSFSFLRRLGAFKECPGRPDAELHHGRDCHRPVDRYRVQPGVLQWIEFYRRPSVDGLTRCGGRSERRLCCDDSAPDVHVLSVDVRDHHARPDDGSVCGADEVLGLSGLLAALVY